MATSRDDITVEVAASQYRQAADAAYRAAVGGAAPGHLPGESLAAYRIRLADGLKGFSPTYKKFPVDSLASMHRAGALGIAEETIYRDAAEAAKRPVGPLRERKELDQSGRPIIRFYGSPDEAWGPFKTPPRYVKAFNTRGGAR